MSQWIYKIREEVDQGTKKEVLHGGTKYAVRIDYDQGKKNENIIFVTIVNDHVGPPDMLAFGVCMCSKTEVIELMMHEMVRLEGGVLRGIIERV
jgi:hypothetical protein